MKRLIGLLMVILMLSCMSGCSSNRNENNEDYPPVDKTLVVINDMEFHLDKETSFRDMHYVIVEDFAEIDHDITIPYRQYNFYQEDSTNLLFFRIFYYKGKGMDYAAKDLGIEGKITLEEGKNENIEYQLYVQPRDDGGTIHFYFITKGKDTYVVNFVSKYDIKDFETKVVNSLHFAQ